MQFDIRFAALDGQVEQRLRLAASLLGAYRLRAQVSAWDGTRCHLLVASTDDAYGRQALGIAARRGTAIIPLGNTESTPGVPTVALNAPASTLARLLQARLQGEAAPARPTDPGDDNAPAVCRLARQPLRGEAIDVTCDGRSVSLRPGVGRVYAQTHSDLFAVADTMSGSDWTLAVVDRLSSMQDNVSASLEAFLVRATHRLRERLPPFAEGRYRLDAWPDLGGAPSVVAAMQVAKLLIGNTRDLATLSATAAGRVDAADFNACLWAFAAAGLLRDDAPATSNPAPQRKQRMEAGLWTSLARRFGLAR